MKTSFLIVTSIVAGLLGSELASAQTASGTYQGTTTTMSKNADGTYTVTRTDANGNTTTKVIGKPQYGPTGIAVGDGKGGWVPYNPPPPPPRGPTGISVGDGKGGWVPYVPK